MPLPWLWAQGKGHDNKKKIVPFFRQFFFGFVIPYQVYSQLKFILDFQDFGGGVGELFIFTKLKSWL
jgi:hypothetical protein